VLLLVAMTALWLLSLVPIPAFQEAVQRLQRGVAGTVGDSYVLRARPIPAAAIIGQVRRFLGWVAKDSARVAIVAHSQGAAIADLALQGDLDGLLDKKALQLITFGSGLRKLEELRQLDKSGKKLGYATIAGAAVALVGLNLLGVLPIEPILTDAPALGWGGLFIGFLFWVGDMADSARGLHFRTEDFRPSRRFGKRLRWYDFYASSDPVPNGPLFDADETPDYLKNRIQEVHNRCSNLTDHTTYWENEEQFVAGAACALGEAVGVNFREMRPGDPVRLRVAKRRREWRVGWLGLARTCTTIATAGLLVALGLAGQLLVLGEELQRGLSKLATNTGLLTGEWMKLPSLQEWSDVTQWSAGAAVLLAGWLAYLLEYACWRRWNRREVNAFFRREDFRLGGLPMVMFLIATFVVLDAAIFAMVISLPRPEGIPPRDLVQVLARLEIPAVLGFIWFMARALVVGKPTGFLAQKPVTRSELVWEAMKEGGLGGVLAAFLAALFVVPLLIYTPLFDDHLEPVGLMGWLSLAAASLLPIGLIHWLGPRVKKTAYGRSAAGSPRITLATLMREKDPVRAARILIGEGQRLLGERARILEAKQHPEAEVDEEIREEDVDHDLRRLVMVSMLFAEDLTERNPSLAAEVLSVPAQVSPEAALLLAELIAGRDPARARKVLEPHATQNAAARRALDKLPPPGAAAASPKAPPAEVKN
jgi:hypothetical protein